MLQYCHMMSNEEERPLDDSILEPLTAYKTVYEKAFSENCEEYFRTLETQSGIDVAANKSTVAKYSAQVGDVQKSKRKLSGYKTGRGLSIAMIVLGSLLLVIGIFSIVQNVSVAAGVLLGVGPALIVLFALLLALVFQPKIKLAQREYDEKQKKAQELLDLAWKQMAPLNALFQDNVTKKLIEKTIPLVELDNNFNVRRYDYLHGKYGYGEGDDPARSTLGILTGEIAHNPFVVDRVLVRTMGTCTYSGSLVISWVTYQTDERGNRVAVNHTQTLTATVTHPKPYYSRETRLIYGNEAAPDLHFSRRPSHAEKLSEKEKEREVEKGAKQIRKQQERSVKDGGSFTEMGNEEFDVLFGALDRDNDVQFRLLFTPLAQKNMLALMEDPSGYGDDFYMRKSGCLNYIMSEHSANWDMIESREKYRSYSYEIAKQKFFAFQTQYFRSLYFDLAPLFSIPLYQQHKPHEYIYAESYARHFTAQESEYAVNRMDESAFAHPEAATPSILKTQFLAKDGMSDLVRVTANSFRAVPRVDFVPVFGGDGYMHDVPVEWVEYVPISEVTTVAMKEIGLSDREFFDEANDGSLSAAFSKYMHRAFGYSHGILCCVVPEEVSGFDAAFTIAKNK